MSNNQSILTAMDDAAIYNAVEVTKRPKAQVARDFGVSARTVGRAILRHLDRLTQPEEVEEVVDTTEAMNDRDSWADIEGEEEYEEDCDFSTFTIVEPEVEEDNSVYSVMASDTSITIWKDGESETITMEHVKWPEIHELVWNSRGAQDTLREVYASISQKQQLINLTMGKITIDAASYSVKYDGRSIDLALRDRIIEAAQTQDETKLNGLVNFTERLYQNPSYRATQELFRFLVAADIEIDQDGMVICFKRVRGNYTDIHSGTFDNSPGKVCEVSRNEVDEDSTRTCSHGLHVCSKSYLPYFGNDYGNRVVKVKVDPAHFVAVPRDYNDAKARVCRYEVMGDVTKEF